jgi:hypothetical protein
LQTLSSHGSKAIWHLLGKPEQESVDSMYVMIVLSALKANL